jgi:transcriptional regulator with XRE-family HTH domain
MPTGKQIRAARVLAGWDIKDLAPKAGLSVTAVQNIETGAIPKPSTSERIIKAFSDIGIEFTDNEGVRRRPQDVEIFEGPERFEEFTNFVYEQIKKHGGHICLSVTDERLFSKYRTNTIEYYENMQELSDRGVIKSFRILANKSNFATKYTYNTYRWQPETTMAPTAFYTFADYLALISFEHNHPPYVLVIQSAPLADSYRRAFDIAWAAGKEPPSPTEIKHEN